MEYSDVLNFFKSKENLLTKEEYNKVIDILSNMRSKDDPAINEASESYKNLGNEAFANEEYEKAYDLYSKGIEINPYNAYLYSNRALVCSKLDRVEEGIKDCIKGIELNPTFIKFYIRLALFYEKIDKQKSIEYINKGLLYDPENNFLRELLNKYSSNDSAKKKFDLSDMLNNPQIQDVVKNFVKDKSPEEVSNMVKNVLGNFK